MLGNFSCHLAAAADSVAPSEASIAEESSAAIDAAVEKPSSKRNIRQTSRMLSRGAGFTIRLRPKDVLLASTLYHRSLLLACHRRACLNNDTEIVKKLVGDWRPLLDAAEFSEC